MTHFLDEQSGISKDLERIQIEIFNGLILFVNGQK
jgi:hypothetical protein